MNATDVIESIELGTLGFEKFVLVSNVATRMRRAMRIVSAAVYDSDPEIGEIVRLSGLKFNTSPAIPEKSLHQMLGFDKSEMVESVWGNDVARECRSFEQALNQLNKKGSLMQDQFVRVVDAESARVGAAGIKIWCHHGEKPIYKELLEILDVCVSDENFICSLGEYRSTDAFDVLVRVGPLRHFGWSSLPRLVLSAPRYRKLVTLSWSGLTDSPEFGLDPVVPGKDYLQDLFERTVKTVEKNDGEIPSHISGEDEVDDLEFFNRIRPKFDNGVDCCLVDIGSGKALMLAPGSSQLIFDPESSEEYVKKKCAGDIKHGDYLILHDVDADLGRSAKTTFTLAPRWKGALRQMYVAHWELLIERMRIAGVNLKNLDAAAKNWSRSDEDVVHAPQTPENFRKLVDDVLPPNCLGGASWQQAWSEIEESRTRVRQDGRIIADIVSEELVTTLNSRSESILERAADSDYFSIRLGRSDDMEGTLRFYKVSDTLQGFYAARDRLAIIGQSDDFERYRKAV